MKFGLRTPSLKKSVSARTTGRLTRSVKRAVLPGYGKKRVGLLTNPKKSIYNKVYNKTSIGAGDLVDAVTPKGSKPKQGPSAPTSQPSENTPAKKGYLSLIIAAVFVLLGIIALISGTFVGFFGMLGLVLLGMVLLLIGAIIAVAWIFT